MLIIKGFFCLNVTKIVVYSGVKVSLYFFSLCESPWQGVLCMIWLEFVRVHPKTAQRCPMTLYSTLGINEVLLHIDWHEIAVICKMMFSSNTKSLFTDTIGYHF